MVSRRTFFREFKLSVCRDVESGALKKRQACRQHSLGATQLKGWSGQYHPEGDDAFKGGDWLTCAHSPEARTRELEAALGRAHLEIELLKDALAKKALNSQDRCEVITHRRPELKVLPVKRCC